MRRLLLITILITLLANTNSILSQSENQLSKDIAIGIAELRQDMFLRKQKYTTRVNEIVAKIDTSSMSLALKKEILEFITQDLKAGGLSSSLILYDQIPKDSPFKNTYIEQYIANNQDYEIDKGIVKELSDNKILTADGKISRPQLEKLNKDFEFLEIVPKDRILLYNAWSPQYAMLLGYSFEGIDITIHNQDLANHYLALDRIDRYPNINNGNVIEFLHKEDPRIMIKGEQWNKIIIRNTRFAEQAPGFILKSLHDNLTDDGYLYVYHDVKSKEAKCVNYPKEEKIIKVLERSDFRLIDKLEIGCQTYFKFQSIKE